MWWPIKKLFVKLKESANIFVLFNTIRYGDSDDFSTQQQFISFPVWDWLELVRYNKNLASYLRAILFAYFFSKRARNLSGCQKSARTTEISILLDCEQNTNTELINLTQPKKHGQLIIFYWYLHNVAWWKVITQNSSHVNNTLLIPSSGPICNQHQIFVFAYIPRNIEPFLWSHVLLYVWAYQSCSSLF